MLQLNGGQRYSFGVFATVIALIAFTSTFAGCKEKQIAMPAPVVIVTDTTHKDTTTAPAAGYTYMALGDSYTIGQNVTEPARYPVQAAAMLTALAIKVNTPDIIALTGWTTRNLLNGIAAAKPKTDYDIVSLLIGVNDQYQEHDTTGYREHFTACLIKAIELAKGKSNHVFVLSIPDYTVTPFGSASGASLIAKQIDQFNEINKSVTLAYSISYTDVTTISRTVKDDPEMLSTDGLHPSGKQYKLWAQVLTEAIAKQLK